MNEEVLTTLYSHTFLTSSVLAIFLSVMIFPLTGKRKNRKDRKFMIPILALLFIGILVLYACIGYSDKYTLWLFLYNVFSMFGFGIIALTVSLIWKEKRTKGSILVSIFIILIAVLAYFSLVAAF